MTSLNYAHIASPVGDLLVAGTLDALHYLSFSTGHKAFGPAVDWRQDDAPFHEVRRQLDAYFTGELRRFDLPLHLSGTAFRTVYGSISQAFRWARPRTYGQIAALLDRPKANRAVGAANGNNPLPIILPCHRVIGASGSLIGFGGGLPTKEYLLRHEGVLE